MISYTHYTDNLPENVGGRTNWFFVRIKHKYRDDRGIHAHEQVYVDQFWSLTLLGVVVAALVYSFFGLEYTYMTLCLGVSASGLLYTLVPKYKPASIPAVAGYGCTLGCYATQSITSLYFENNKVLNSQYAGVNVTGAIGTWRYWNNQVDAGSSVGYSNVATITNKTSFYNYVEGTFTPNQGAGLTVVGAFSSAASYTKIGRQVTVVGSVSGATSVAVGTLGIICSNLPYPAVGGYGMGSSTNGALTATGAVQVEVSTLYSCTAIGATGTIYFSLTYFTTAE